MRQSVLCPNLFDSSLFVGLTSTILCATIVLIIVKMAEFPTMFKLAMACTLLSVKIHY